MRVPSVRRLALMLGVLVLAGKGAQGLRNMLASLLARRSALAGAASTAAIAAAPEWRLFSVFLRDLQEKKVTKVLLAADHVLVHAAEGGAVYKCV